MTIFCKKHRIDVDEHDGCPHCAVDRQQAAAAGAALLGGGYTILRRRDGPPTVTDMSAEIRAGTQALTGGKPASALNVQVAGAHYKGKKIQPVEYIHANGLNFLEGCIVKRITRWRDKPAEHRFQDLEKIKHEIDLLIELESRQ